MYYFDNSPDMARRPARRDGLPVLTVGDEVVAGRSRDERELQGCRRDPASNGEVPDGRVDGDAAYLHSLGTWRVPEARPPADGADGADGADMSCDGQRYSAASWADRPCRGIAGGIAVSPRISVVVPAMNEAANLPGVFATIPAWVDEIVLVDGRSADDTIEVAQRLRPDVRVVHQGGVGKGDALVAGFAASTGDIIVAIDADGSTDGTEIARFVSALMAGADFAKGSRFSSGGGSDDITAIRRLGNKILNLMVNWLFGTSFSDLCYGYNAFWAHNLGKLRLDSPGFEVETLMSVRAARAGMRIHEVPSHERLRQHGMSNLRAARDGWRIVRLIMTEKWATRRSKRKRPAPFMAPGYLAQGSGSVRALPVRGRIGSDGALHDGAAHDTAHDGQAADHASYARAATDSTRRPDGERRGWATAGAAQGRAATGITHGSAGLVHR